MFCRGCLNIYLVIDIKCIHVRMSFEYKDIACTCPPVVKDETLEHDRSWLRAVSQKLH